MCDTKISRSSYEEIQTVNIRDEATLVNIWKLTQAPLLVLYFISVEKSIFPFLKEQMSKNKR